MGLKDEVGLRCEWNGRWIKSDHSGIESPSMGGWWVSAGMIKSDHSGIERVAIDYLSNTFDKR